MTYNSKPSKKGNVFRIPNKVIIWGNDNSNMLGVVRQLGECMIETFVLFNQRTARITNNSKYCKRYYIANDLDDGINFLKTHFNEERDKPVLLCTGDIFAEQIDIHRDELEQKFLLYGPRQKGILANLLEKSAQCNLAQEIGLTVPSFSIYSDKMDISKIKYPCIIKPTKRNKNSGPSFKIRKCGTESELKKAISEMDINTTYLIQDYIEGYRLAVVDGCRLRNGETIISGTLMCQKGGETCDSSFGYIDENIPACIPTDMIINLLEKIDYYGPFGLDFGIANDRAYFFEINLRIDATNYVFYKMGAHFLELWALDATGHDISQVPKAVKGKMYFIDDIGELGQVYNGVLTKKEWDEDMAKAEIYKFRNSADPYPYYLQRGIYGLLIAAKKIKSIANPLTSRLH